MKDTSRDYSNKTHIVIMWDNHGWSDMSETNDPEARVDLLKRYIREWQTTGTRHPRFNHCIGPESIQYAIVPRSQVNDASVA